MLYKKGFRRSRVSLIKFNENFKKKITSFICCFMLFFSFFVYAASDRDTALEHLGLSKKATYYDILGVSAKATEEEIKKAYKERAKEFHPDRHPNEAKELFEAIFKLVGEAYDTLEDAKKRKSYDRSHKSFTQNHSHQASSQHDNEVKAKKRKEEQAKMWEAVAKTWKEEAEAMRKKIVKEAKIVVSVCCLALFSFLVFVTDPLGFLEDATEKEIKLERAELIRAEPEREKEKMLQKRSNMYILFKEEVNQTLSERHTSLSEKYLEREEEGKEMAEFWKKIEEKAKTRKAERNERWLEEAKKREAERNFERWLEEAKKREAERNFERWLEEAKKFKQWFEENQGDVIFKESDYIEEIIKSSRKQAVDFWLKAANQDHVAAQLILAKMYDVYDDNKREAYKWYSKLEKQGYYVPGLGFRGLSRGQELEEIYVKDRLSAEAQKDLDRLSAEAQLERENATLTYRDFDWDSQLKKSIQRDSQSVTQAPVQKALDQLKSPACRKVFNQ